jgi:hypothetical protein
MNVRLARQAHVSVLKFTSIKIFGNKLKIVMYILHNFVDEISAYWYIEYLYVIQSITTYILKHTLQSPS